VEATKLKKHIQNLSHDFEKHVTIDTNKERSHIIDRELSEYILEAAKKVVKCGYQHSLLLTPPMMSTSEGEEVNPEEKSTTPHWYSAPREKRKKGEEGTSEKSPRLHKTKASSVEAKRVEENNSRYENHRQDKVYGLGVPKQTHSDRKGAEHPIIKEAPQGTGRTNIPFFQNPRIITQEALNAVAFCVMEARPDWTVPTSMDQESKYIHFNVEHFCAQIIHPTTGKLITKYAELAKDAEMREVWTTAIGKKIGQPRTGRQQNWVSRDKLFIFYDT